MHQTNSTEINRSALNPVELASRWGCHPNTIRKMLREGQLSGFRIRNNHLITLTEIERVESHGTGVSSHG
jgi:hypothetical protein